MLTYNLTATGSDSLYESLYKCIKNDILQGKLCAGEKLPSKRSFAKNLGISVITVENAYGQLSDEGYIYSMPKRGFYVSDIDMVVARGINMKGISQSADRNISGDNYIYGMESFNEAASSLAKSSYFADFSSNQTDSEIFPFSIWSKTVRSVLNDNQIQLMINSPCAGILPLRNAIAHYLRDFRGMQVFSHQIIIGAGTEYLYGLLIQLLGKDLIYGVENPGYHKIGKICKSMDVSYRHVDLDENGVSSRSYQRFVQGNSELRISDLAIIVEILSISPMEMTEKLTPMSKTVLAKEQFNQAIFSKNFQESSRIVADYRAYYDKSSFALGKQEVMYSMLALEYLFNPQTVVTKEEIIALENQILERLINADVYTIFNLKFLALQKNVGLQPFPTSLLFRVLQSVNEREIIDICSLEIIEQVIIDFLFAAIVSQNVPHILHVLSMFKEYEVGENNWRMILWKKIAEKIEMILTNEEIFADWSIFKEQILLSITLFLPKAKQEFFAGQLEKIEDSLKEIKEN